MAGQTLNDRLREAQREAGGLKERLAAAEAELAKALERQDYPAAEKAKTTADGLRQPFLIAEAHVKALIEGVQELERHQAEEQRAAQERDRREQAKVQFEAATGREAEAEADMDRLLAEVHAAYGALRQTLQGALDAQQRVGEARRDAWQTGMAAGIWPPDAPQPALPNRASMTIEYSPVLTQIWRNPQLLP